MVLEQDILRTMILPMWPLISITAIRYYLRIILLHITDCVIFFMSLIDLNSQLFIYDVIIFVRLKSCLLLAQYSSVLLESVSLEYELIKLKNRCLCD